MIWLAYIIEQEPHDTRAMIERLKKLRITQKRTRAKESPVKIARTAPPVRTTPMKNQTSTNKHGHKMQIDSREILL
eukprot:IDg19898t1